VIIFVKKGGPTHLIGLRKKNIGVITTGTLLRRSKKIEASEHWSETRLGEISTNTSLFCKSPKDVLYDSSIRNLLRWNSNLIHKDQLRVYSCDLEEYVESKKEFYPFNKTIAFRDDFLNIIIMHNKTACNYPHTDINCFLTTKDGKFNNEIVRAKDWKRHPFSSKKFKGLRGMYKTHLIYHFSNIQDFDDI
jgi:hypothetical protein